MTITMTENQNKAFLIDGSGYIFRAYHAMQHLSNSKGFPTNALYGFLRMLLPLLTKERPGWVVMAFDTPDKGERARIYPQYKANRPPVPDDLLVQMSKIDELVQALNIKTYRIPGYEADDIIATMVRKTQGWGLQPVVVSADKDLMQLVSDQVHLYDPMKDKYYGIGEVQEKFGVEPAKLTDLLALAGDSSDNIPGVAGIGVKTAADYLNRFGCLEGVIAAADEAQIGGKRGKTLQEQRDTALLSRELVRLREDVPLDADTPDQIRLGAQNNDELIRLFTELEFHSLAREMGYQTRQESTGQPLKVDSEVQGTSGSGTIPQAQAQIQPSAKGSSNGQLSLLDQFESYNLDHSSPHKQEAVSGSHRALYRTISNREQLTAVVKELKEAGMFALDTETTSVDPMEARLVGVSLAWREGQACYIPVGHYYLGVPEQITMADLTSILKPIMEDGAIPKYAQNCKYDYMVLMRHGIRTDGLVFDPMLASYLLDPGRQSHSLDHLAQEFLGIETITFDQVINGTEERTNGEHKNQILELSETGDEQSDNCEEDSNTATSDSDSDSESESASTPASSTGKKKKAISGLFSRVDIERATRYAAEDADLCLRLGQALEPAINQAGLSDFLAKVEVPMAQVLAHMELNGIRVDTEQLGAMSLEFENRLAALEEEIYAAAGCRFLISSPKQLGEVLFDKLQLPQIKKTKTGRSTDVNVLEALRYLHPVPALVLDYRSIAKLKSTYVDALPLLVNRMTGRLHTCFNQTVTATGRLSSSNPNLQNIPVRTAEGRRIRAAFVADPGNVLLSADYSQIELRVLAHMSGDPVLTESFRNNEDIHTRTASEIFEVFPGLVSPEQRRAAKAINFGIIYGMSAFRLARDLGVPQGQAKTYMSNYFKRYSGVEKYLKQVVQDARSNGYVTTMYGRRRYLPDLVTGGGQARAQAERMALNTPIQGSAADIIKLAMVNLAERLEATPSLQARLLLQVHDELVLEVPRDQAEQLKDMVVSSMEGAATLSVPLKVDVAVATNWADAH